MELREKIAWGISVVSVAASLGMAFNGLRSDAAPRNAVETNSKPESKAERIRKSEPRVKRQPRPEEKAKPKEAASVQQSLEQVEKIAEGVIDSAVKERIAAMHKERKAIQEKRKAEMLNLSDEEKSARREAFIAKMHDRAQKRLKEFVQKAGLNTAQTDAFSSTVAALDTTLQERTQEWARKIRETGTFSPDARIKFIGDVVEVLNAGYAEMDASLPSTWRTGDGSLNLMQLVGDAAFAPVAEALIETGLEDGLQTIGMLMGGQRGPGGEGGGVPGGPEGMDAPGIGGGPGGADAPSDGNMNGGSGMGGPGAGGPDMGGPGAGGADMGGPAPGGPGM